LVSENDLVDKRPRRKHVFNDIVPGGAFAS
jgi:hypothetical protein